MVSSSIRSPKEIESIRKSGQILTEVLDILVKKCRPGITSMELDKIADVETRRLGGVPAFLGYQGFPGRVCVSVNNEIVHAIPNTRSIKSGDLVGIDYGVSFGGMITDAARTISVGKSSSDAQRLINGCYEALQQAIGVIKDGVLVGDVSSTIEDTLRKYRLKPIYSLTGHGVGHELHEDPIIPNYGRSGRGEALLAGMTIAVEPIASIGTNDLYLAEDGWTYMTRDGSLSAQFENTLLVTRNGCEIIAS